MPLEVEMKFPLADVGAMRGRLDQRAAVWSTPIEQSDTYFSHPVRDFAQTDEALRVRTTAAFAGAWSVRTHLTYKGPLLDALTKTREEREVELLPGTASPGEIHAILTALGFCPLHTVVKRRQPGELVWRGVTVGIAVDDVVGLGAYLELEIVCEPESADAARETILSLASELELPRSERRSYLRLLLEKSGER